MPPSPRTKRATCSGRRAKPKCCAEKSACSEQYDVKLGGKKGNITLHSFDGHYKVQIAVAENIQFDERLQAAKALIDECINVWTQNSRDDKWQCAMKAIGESVQVVGSKEYIRFYQRVGSSEKYEPLSLDIAAV